jgi:hypothetical protein
MGREFGESERRSGSCPEAATGPTNINMGQIVFPFLLGELAGTPKA